MEILFLILGALLGIAVLVLLIALISFLKVFYSSKRKLPGDDEYPLPPGKAYVPFHSLLIEWTKKSRSMPHEDFEITSHDGLKLRARYYEFEKGAPIELLFHGYRGSSERDLSVGIERCFRMGRSAMLIDQRAHGRSEGSVISFGVNESRDCRLWVDFAISHFGESVKLILTGVSMGAATVIMAAAEPLPKNVVSVLADCGYSSARKIISKIIAEMHLPPKIVYPFVWLGARIFGGFELEDAAPVRGAKNVKIPIIFIHGDEDSFVPYEMSEENFAECVAQKKLALIKGAQHGSAYAHDKEAYVKTLTDFEREVGFLSDTE